MAWIVWDSTIHIVYIYHFLFIIYLHVCIYKPHHFFTLAAVPSEFNIDDDDHFSLLTNKLSDIAARYSDFGVQLCISNDRIKEIEQRVHDVKRYLQDMLADWLKQGKPLTDVLDALRGPAIRNPNLAGKLERKWRQDGFCE